jgi:hypothetical protein
VYFFQNLDSVAITLIPCTMIEKAKETIKNSFINIASAQIGAGIA